MAATARPLRAPYRCVECGATVTPDATVWRCPHCGGLLDVDSFAVAAPDPGDHARPGLWRYLPALPLVPDSGWERATMGEGATALVLLDPSRPGVLAKVDFAMPTRSFKDRGAAVLLATAAGLGAERVIVDSSGNAGTAVAAYAARLGLDCRVFVPVATTPAKLAAVIASGARVEVVDGSREDTATAAQSTVAQTGAFYASHVYQPVFHHGVKTMLWEVVESLGRAPDTLVLPAGNGTYVLGCALATDELLRLGLIDQRPRIVAVQAAACAPLAAAFAAGADAAAPVTNTGTAADGIAIAAPPRARQVLAAVRRSGGSFVTVDEGQIAAAHAWLAGKGWPVEPTAAATVAGWRAVAAERELDGTTVLPLCGAR